MNPRFMVCLLVLTSVVLGGTLRQCNAVTRPIQVASPNGRLAVDFRLDEANSPRYTVRLGGQIVLRESDLGLVRDDADFSKSLRVVSASPVTSVRDSYEILTSKRRLNNYLGNRRVFRVQTAAGRPMDIIFQVSDDGVAFRYFFPDADAKIHSLSEEISSFHFLPGTRAWLQPMSVAKTGWQRTNPSYEENYQKEIAVGTPSTLGAGWVYPALFRSGQNWILLSEGSLPRDYCGTRLRSESPDGEYRVGFPDPRENYLGGAVNPQGSLPWLTPWRFIVVGSLKVVAESTLGVDLADKPSPATLAALRGANFALEPGKSSWSWVLLGDRQTNPETTRRFIDYAAEMKWRYCLVDALWDRQIGQERMKELVDYARGKGVKMLVWYNSNGDWNGAPQTPRNILVTRESRVAEFARLQQMGIAGLKIDFFGGDGQSVIGYYHDLLEDAARFGLSLNFHGATLPRGWQRTYPHLMTAEAIKGQEFITFGQDAADEQPTHAAMLPFTRNVFDPMDFTPVVLDRLPRFQRRTTSAFELACSVLFTSGIQHYAETPEGLAKAPVYVSDFLKNVPAVWDDSRFLDGYPGQYAVMARRSGNRWYLSGINGTASAKKLSLDLRELKVRGVGTLIADGEGGNLSFRQETLNLAGKKMEITLPATGGFVAVLD